MLRQNIILLADDDARLRSLVRITLADPNYRFLEAADGLTALKVSRRVKPDLVLLDWMMPGLSGLQVLRRLREDEATRDIPIVMLTSRAAEADRAEAEGLGASGFLVKPFSPLELLQRTEKALSKAQLRDGDAPDERGD